MMRAVRSGTTSPAWSVDGKRIFVSAFAENQREATRNGHEWPHPHSAGESLWVDWTASPDGKRIAYLYIMTESNVMLLEHF